MNFMENAVACYVILKILRKSKSCEMFCLGVVYCSRKLFVRTRTSVIAGKFYFHLMVKLLNLFFKAIICFHLDGCLYMINLGSFTIKI